MSNRGNQRNKKKHSRNWFNDLLSKGVKIFTILSGLVSIGALGYLYLQYNTSIKPDIIVNDGNAELIVERYRTNGYVHYLIENDSIERKNLSYNSGSSGSSFTISPNAEFNSFAFSLTNVGLGVAKNVRLSWSFDTLGVIKIFNDNKPIPYLDSVKFENSTFVFFDKEGENPYSETSEPKDYIINYILPVSSSKEGVKCKLPYLYLRLYSCHEILSNFIRIKSNPSNEARGKFPPLYLNVNYQDIGSANYYKRYSITFKNEWTVSSEFQIRTMKKIQFNEVLE